jgi:hypothetical protein
VELGSSELEPVEPEPVEPGPVELEPVELEPEPEGATADPDRDSVVGAARVLSLRPAAAELPVVIGIVISAAFRPAMALWNSSSVALLPPSPGLPKASGIGA